MSDTTFTDFQPPAINAAWLNDVNGLTYGAFNAAQTMEDVLSEMPDADDTIGFETRGLMSVADRTKLDSLSGGYYSITTDATTSRVLALSDLNDYIRMTSSSANTVTVPDNATVAFIVGSSIHIRQAGTGQTTVVASAGVTINTADTLALRAQGSTMSLVKVGTDEWDLFGDTASS